MSDKCIKCNFPCDEGMILCSECFDKMQLYIPANVAGYISALLERLEYLKKQLDGCEKENRLLVLNISHHQKWHDNLVIDNDDIRRILWTSRALRAKSEQNTLMRTVGTTEWTIKTKWPMIGKWEWVENKCLEKAKEYTEEK